MVLIAIFPIANFEDIRFNSYQKQTAITVFPCNRCFFLSNQGGPFQVMTSSNLTRFVFDSCRIECPQKLAIRRLATKTPLPTSVYSWELGIRRLATKLCLQLAASWGIVRTQNYVVSEVRQFYYMLFFCFRELG